MALDQDASKEELHAAALVARRLADAAVDTVADVHPEGAPSGPMYMAFMQAGMSYNTFVQLMTALCGCGRIRKMGHCYYLTDSEIQRRGLNGN